MRIAWRFRLRRALRETAPPVTRGNVRYPTTQVQLTLRRAFLVALTTLATACASHASLAIPEGKGAVRVEVNGAVIGPAKPLTNALITLALAGRSTVIGEVKSDSSGVVVFNRLEPGRYSLRVRLLGFYAVRREFTVSRGRLRLERIRLESSINCVRGSRGEVTICM